MYGKEGPIKISFFSKRLGVSDRTTQGITRLLEEGAITINPIFNENGKQQGNLYRWIGNVDSIKGSPTMEMLYARYDSYGFRSFTWDDYKMETDPDVKVACHDYLQYLDLTDEKERLKMRRGRKYKANLLKPR